MSTLKVEETICLAAPVERVWKFLLDPAAVAGCLPGARLDAVEDERNFTGTMKVKVGPVTTEFRGKASFTEVVPEEHRVRLQASGDDKGGAGSAKMPGWVGPWPRRPKHSTRGLPIRAGATPRPGDHPRAARTPPRAPFPRCAPPPGDLRRAAHQLVYDAARGRVAHGA